MNQEQKHRMNLVDTHPSGVEEWHCPHCEHRMVLQWMPYKKMILAEGDNYALHSAYKGDFQFMSAEVESQSEIESQSEAEEQTILSEALRDALDSFMQDIDFGD